ncbi:MAG: enoyl-CoA hydratase-related protein [Rhodobacteraceae bacterium]|nr:enoyl-CoA hydratase-related protein [Paracoccaceae bacterium]
MAFQCISSEVSERVATISLARGKMNPLSRELLDELCAALRQHEADNSVRCMILTGNDEHFCAGADIKEMANLKFVDIARNDGFAEVAKVLRNCRKPLIAAVKGLALGGGCELAMMCDMILAGESARFGQPEINLGLIAGIGGTQNLTRAVGKSLSMEMNLTGRWLDASEALSFGLVSRVVADSDLRREAEELAKRIADKPPLAIMAAKEAVLRAEEVSLAEGLLHERRLFHALFATRDKDEGIQAFIEKREARFQGE